jgi:hypothetical protein
MNDTSLASLLAEVFFRMYCNEYPCYTEFRAFTCEFRAFTRKFRAFTREFCAFTREFESFTREFGF